MSNNLPPIEIALISVPYALDRRDDEMGLAPAALLDNGLVAALETRNVVVAHATTVAPSFHGDTELARVGELQQAVAADVAAALRNQWLPVLLGGDCTNALGVWQGIADGMPSLTTGVAWFDAHGDWNTPETTPSGYLGGMPYAAICGHGNEAMRAAAGVTAVAPPRLCALIGARDLDPPEADALHASDIALVTADDAQHDYSAAVTNLTVIDAFYLHFDVDVLDPAVAPGVTYPAPGGLTVGRAVDIARGLIANKPLVAISLTAVNPARDVAGATVEAGMQVLLDILSD